MKSLESLVYVSSAVRPVSEARLRHVLERARWRNKRCDVTGLLLFDAGNFMQYIEGPHAGLSEVYEHIRRDDLHTGLIELCREPTSDRVFGDWDMAASVFDLGGQVRNLTLNTNPRSIFSSLSVTHGSAGILLRGFWQRNQRLI